MSLAEQAADQMGVDVVRAGNDMDIGVIYDQSNPFLQGGQEAPMVRLLWEGWQEHSRLPTDTLANVSAANLEQAGRSLALAVMTLGRDTQYQRQDTFPWVQVHTRAQAPTRGIPVLCGVSRFQISLRNPKSSGHE
ncbi:MAG: hypothetical protein GQ526_03370 [Ardenticatenales bacterium]|nr:hypothetical protein [Ardenticatenales bacterium]